DGLQDERGLRVEGLQRQVLRRRGAFTAADFAFLRDRIAALSTRAEAPVDAFLARCAEADAAPPVPAAQAAPALIDAGRWYVEPLEDGLAGLRVDLPAEAAALTDEMRARGLLGAADLVRPLPEAPLPVEVQVPAFAEARDQAEQAFRFKSALLIACGLLVLCVVGLVAADARRRRRYVELKGDFVSAVSHELRTPLASIRLMAETLERRLTGETRARDYPARIVGEVDRLGFLVENILSFNRLDKGRWVARAQPVSLGAVLDQVREALTDAFERPIEWQQQGIDGRTLTADPELLLLLFTNLARNAATYNNRDPIRITVDVQSMGAGCRIRFSDNGRGIPAGAVRHVFTEFYRAPRTAERGSGLGLALCDRIMALHRGRITLAKTSPAGTTFELRFP
ncbi:MAG: sensor histidine kinase, partial [Myxococcales bacterium]|nr:sensor histidine kinase [Myxococcales bacterium]